MSKFTCNGDCTTISTALGQLSAQGYILTKENWNVLPVHHNIIRLIRLLKKVFVLGNQLGGRAAALWVVPLVVGRIAVE